MSELIRELDSVELTVSEEKLEEEIVEILAKTEDSYKLSHGSHNQHSSSK